MAKSLPHRTIGLIWLAVGMILLGVSAGYPVARALNDAPEITIIPKFVLGSIAVIAFSVVIFLNIKFFEDGNNLKFRDIFIVLVIAGIGLAAYYAFQRYVESLGYVFPPL